MRRLLTTLALLVLAGHLAATDRAARAEGGAPPPPGFGDDQLTIPKELIRAYLSQVHPSYLRWLGNGDGSGEDSLAAFTIYLSTQPVNRFERWCFTQLYIRSH